jgi:apolipoprotein N-acyltransferase
MWQTKQQQQLSMSLMPTSQPLLTAFWLASATALLTAAAGFYEALWPLTWAALLPLLLALPYASARRALVLGWWAETLMYWLGFYWLVGTMVRFGFIPLPLSLLLFCLIGVGNGLRLGLFAWGVRLGQVLDMPWWGRFLLPPCLYVALDYLFPRVCPWYLGFLQLPALPIIQIADVTGVHGITFLLVACSTVLSAWVPHFTAPPLVVRWRMALIFVLLTLATVGYGMIRMQQVSIAMAQARPLRLTLVQPNIGMYEKHTDAHRKSQLDLQVRLSQNTLQERPELIIWPESMYPYTVDLQKPRIALPRLSDPAKASWLIGALSQARQGDERQVFNSAFLIGPDSRILGRYDKQHLLAFGEYIPWQRYLPFLRHISPTIGNLTPGTGGIVTLPQGIGIGPLICYEDIVPALGRQAVRQGAQVLVNLTNDIWFGDTRAPYQHRALAAFRAVENRVYLVRVTNTGLTSIIDAIGREQAALPMFQAQTVVHDIQPLQLATLYTRFGDWFAQGCSVVAGILLLGYSWGRYRARGTARR